MKRNVLQIFSFILCVAFALDLPVVVRAEESNSEEPIYYDSSRKVCL